MSAATFFGLKGPKAPFFWARFPRFGGCAIPARAVFFHYWAYFAKKSAKWALSLSMRRTIFMNWGGRPSVLTRPMLPLWGPGTPGSSRPAVMWHEVVTRGRLAEKALETNQYLS
jgi:hypothetical protein